MNAGASVFYLIGKPHQVLIENLIPTVPRIIRFRELNEPPFIAHVTRPDAPHQVGSRPGKVEMKLSNADWLAAKQKAS